MVYGVQNPQELYNQYGINGFYNQYGLNNNASPSVFGYGYNQNTDDGKISFGEKVGSFFKGIGKSVVNGVKSLLTPKGLLKTAAVVGACMIPGVGPLIGAGLAAFGVAKGASTVVKGAAQAANATTDAEAKAAWENIGGGAFTTAASAVGLKGAAKAIGNMNKAAGTASLKDMSVLDKAKTTWTNAKDTFANSKLGGSVTKVTNAYKEGGAKFTEKLGSAKDQVVKEAKAGYSSVKTKYAETKTASNAAKDAQKDITTKQNNQAELKNVSDKLDDYKDAVKNDDGIVTSYKNSKGETITTAERNELMTQQSKLQAEIKSNPTANSVQKAQDNAFSAAKKRDSFKNEYKTSEVKIKDGVEGYYSKDGKAFISKENYTKQLETLQKNTTKAANNLKEAKASYSEATKATEAKAAADKTLETELASAKKITDLKARGEAIKQAKTNYNNTINKAVAGVESQAAKNLLRGETSITKAISGGFTRATKANGWDMKGANSMALANQLEEANSEYEMYNQYLQSVGNTSTGYSA